MKVEIWSDIVCPWCYIGKRRFETALARFPHRDAVEVAWRSFELDPAAPRQRDVPNVDHLAGKYGVSRTEAAGMQERMRAVAADEGLDFRFDIARSGNTFDAHRLLHFAADRGAQDAVKERLFAGYLTEGEPIGDRETLVRLAAEVGLDATDVRTALEGDDYADDVRADESDARALGVSGVPFFVVDRAYGVSGAQAADLLVQVLEKAWGASHPLTTVGGAGGSCDDGSCGD